MEILNQTVPIAKVRKNNKEILSGDALLKRYQKDFGSNIPPAETLGRYAILEYFYRDSRYIKAARCAACLAEQKLLKLKAAGYGVDQMKAAFESDIEQFKRRGMWDAEMLAREDYALPLVRLFYPLEQSYRDTSFVVLN